MIALTITEAVEQNPFYVLGVSLECPRAEVEREGQKLLAMLALDLADVKTYQTPLGQRTRTPELVRSAMAELRAPERRLAHELLATLPANVLVEIGGNERDERWPEAPALFGCGFIKDPL